MTLTAEQRLAVEAPGSVLVQAGAGTGKTHLLVSRYIHHLKQGQSPLEVVAVTFTERAAFELRARIRKQVQDQSLGQTLEAELEAAPLGTLHALAARICREHPSEAGVPPDFKLMDAPQAELRSADHFEFALSTLPPEVLSCLNHSQWNAVLPPLLKDSYNAHQAFEVPTERLRERLERARVDAWQEVMGTEPWSVAVGVLQFERGNAQDKLELQRQAVIDGLEAFTFENPDSLYETLDGVRLTVGSQKAWPEGSLERVKSALKTLREIIRDHPLLKLSHTAHDQRLVELLPLIHRAFVAIDDALWNERIEAGMLEFADLERGAMRALGHASVSAHYHLRFKALLLDECQDTSPVQLELLQTLFPLAPLTLVGDPQQSVYGFRGAGTDMFERLGEWVRRRGGNLIRLSQSFRAHPALLEGINAITQQLLGTDLHRLFAAREPVSHPSPYLRSHRSLTQEGKDLLKHEQLWCEASEVAVAINELFHQDFTVFDPVLNDLRPLQWGDVAVLGRTWKALEVVHQGLLHCGIAVWHGGGGNLLETSEVQDGVAWLRFLASPEDEVALASVLRGPAFVWSDAALHTLFQARAPGEKGWDVLVRLQDADAYRTAYEVIAPLLLNRVCAPAELLQVMEAATEWREVLQNLPAGERRLADWDGLLEWLEAQEDCLHPQAAVHRIERLRHREILLPRPILAAREAITLTSVHRAKGLEWPVVFLVDQHKHQRGYAASVVWHPQDGVALRPEGMESAGGESSGLFSLLSYQARQRQSAEEKRLSYVALTRARELVYEGKPLLTYSGV